MNGASQKKEKEERFGTDFNLISEVIITGKGVGARKLFYSMLAHHKDLFRRVIKLVLYEPEFDIVVTDYQQPLRGMLTAAKIDTVELRGIDIESRNRSTGKNKRVAVKLFRFHSDLTREEIFKRINSHGCFRFSWIEELLALAKKYPDLQKLFPIISLDWYWEGANKQWVAGLDFTREKGRRFALRILRPQWPKERFYFLAVLNED